MFYIESNDILINIYKNRMQKISYDILSQLAIKIWNRHFIGRTTYVFESIGYMEPLELVPYENTDVDIISHPLCHIFYMEKDYPYILYSKQVDGWYAWLHLPGINEFKFNLTEKLAHELYMIYDMYSDMVTLSHITSDHESLYTVNDPNTDNVYDKIDTYLRYGYGLYNTRQSLYYPKKSITLQPYNENDLIVNGDWKHSNIVTCSYDTLYERINTDIPEWMDGLLDDYCFIAGGFLFSKAINDVYIHGPYLEHETCNRQDIDLFIVRGNHDGYTKLKQVITILTNEGYEIKRKGTTFVAYKRYEHPIQICPINYSSIMDIIDNFDTSCTAIAYNGKEIFASHNFKKYIRYGASYCKFKSMRKTRLNKYIEKGIKLLFNREYYIEDDVDNKQIDILDDEKQELNYDTCFDDNLFKDKLSNPDEMIISGNGVYSFTSWMNRFELKDYLTEDQIVKARELCNRLADGYVKNDICDEKRYKEIMIYIGHSEIDHYLRDPSYGEYPYYLITGLKNDMSMILFNILYRYEGC